MYLVLHVECMLYIPLTIAIVLYLLQKPITCLSFIFMELSTETLKNGKRGAMKLKIFCILLTLHILHISHILQRWALHADAQITIKLLKQKFNIL